MKYLDEEQQVKVKPNCSIGVGYNMCTDINFRAADLIKLLERNIYQMEFK